MREMHFKYICKNAGCGKVWVVLCYNAFILTMKWTVLMR